MRRAYDAAPIASRGDRASRPHRAACRGALSAETTAGAIIFTASHFGIPLSTTHVISTSIMGVGAMKRFSAVKWGLVHRIVWAWVLTIPATGLLGYLFAKVFMICGMSR